MFTATVLAITFLYLVMVGLCLAVVGGMRSKLDPSQNDRMLGVGPDALHTVELTIEHCRRLEYVPVFVEETREVA